MITIDNKDQWYIDRWGKLTASRISEILVKGRSGEAFGVGAMTYIKQKAVERMTNYWENPKLEYVSQLLHGKAIEYQGFSAYVERTQNDSMEYFGTDSPAYFAYNEDSGGSPDAIMRVNGKVKWGAEIKCPFSPAVHYEYLKLKNQWDFKDYCPEYYAQIQMLIMIFQKEGCEGWDFCSFDERFKDPKKQAKIITIEPEKKFIETLDIKIDMAVTEINRLIKALN
jgi:hypothetical protein